MDPPGSTDLDQAFAIERDGGGWRVFYAIADVPAFVPPGGAIDAEAHVRGQTIYAADGRIPLHPAVDQRGRRVAAARSGARRVRLGARARRRAER